MPITKQRRTLNHSVNLHKPTVLMLTGVRSTPDVSWQTPDNARLSRISGRPFQSEPKSQRQSIGTQLYLVQTLSFWLVQKNSISSGAIWIWKMHSGTFDAIWNQNWIAIGRWWHGLKVKVKKEVCLEKRRRKSLYIRTALIHWDTTLSCADTELLVGPEK